MLEENWGIRSISDAILCLTIRKGLCDDTWKAMSEQTHRYQEGCSRQREQKWEGSEEGACLACLRKGNEVRAAGIKRGNWRVTGEEAREGPAM